MGSQPSNSHDVHTRLVSLGADARTGIAKDQLVFIIICATALAVATFTIARSSSKGSKAQPSIWQCVDCGHEFKKAAYPPPECPKCGGQAARLVNRDCPSCGKNVLYCRVHVPQAAEDSTGPGGGQPGLGMMQPMPVQYWVKQEDGGFGWSPKAMAGSAQATQLERGAVCQECGTNLSSTSDAGKSE